MEPLRDDGIKGPDVAALGLPPDVDLALRAAWSSCAALFPLDESVARLRVVSLEPLDPRGPGGANMTAVAIA